MVIVNAVGTFTDVADIFIMMFLIALLIPVWGIGPADIALIPLIGTPVGIISTLAAGVLLDTLGRKKTWVIGNLGAGIFSLLMAISQNWIQFVVLNALRSAINMLAIQGVYVIIAEEAPADRRSFVDALATSLPGLFAQVGLGALVALGILWRFLLVFVGIANLVAVVLGILILREPPIWLERRKLRKEGEKGGWAKNIKLLLDKRYRGVYWSAVIVAVLIGFRAAFHVPYSDYGSWFMVTILGFGPIIGYWGMLSGVFDTIVRHYIGWLADKLGRLKSGLIFVILAIISSQIMWRLPYFIPVGPHLALIIPWVICYYIYNHVGHTDLGWFMMIGESIPTPIRAVGMTLQSVIRSLLLLALSPAVGFIVAGLPSPIELFCWYQLAIGVIALIIIVLAMKKGYETAGKELE